MREIIAGILIIAGIITFIISVIGLFRFKYVLNRMHAAAVGDTLALGLVVLGLLIIGINVFVSIKLLLIIIFFWLTGPISTHMIARVEMLTNSKYEERVHDK